MFILTNAHQVYDHNAIISSFLEECFMDMGQF